MAHKKAGGSTQLGRESESKRLGVKIYSGQGAEAGQIIIRQRGSHYTAGDNVKVGGDDTLYAGISGIVNFIKRKKRTFTGKLKYTTVVSLKKTEENLRR
ncbi:MAG: 50S ribosomal protein L27 [Candidatus Andersenbacteria bacterium RIFCSPHIGHO2_12_FULL_46_9]|nr:MAG: 50S ribosomal protein L27 [Parcubacteria group bacterium GW2011_GWA2_45_14]OGY35854.1 MAG: 50S ribosomal protein L27 [Candidatus Andersenbacteria bacterium RIFCSPHIGHO2_02_FULL_46_16]OGY36085.1 MAG: 50S ribosomal protein L27 [Candidatus Andersenbacteria bacterium RIFCSPLOWO2_02_FULL_46_11]OGY37761.1 MAG: 50S ribosomal protein L27 [Candidatus Andersenbacteria bacterium RIFCSPHIGHO2_12_FULL_46_9]OGY38935.1 MAG: 50S ribosomal protein L27 [Candidatus Andersenbacteria bacterium RIFCSPLOWO2_1